MGLTKLMSANRMRRLIRNLAGFSVAPLEKGVPLVQDCTKSRRTRHRSAMVEALETRQCLSNFFNFEVLARTGDSGLVSIKPGVSINDNGYIAFVGESNNQAGELADNIYASRPGAAGPNQLMPSVFMYKKEGAEVGLNPGTQSIFNEVQINNQNLVLARRRLNAQIQVAFPIGQILTAPLTYLETWDASYVGTSLPVSQVANGVPAVSSAPLWFFLNPVTGGVYPSPLNVNTAFEGLYHDSTINNLGQVNFSAIVYGAGDNRISSNINGDLVGRGPISASIRPLQPMLADNGDYVFTTGDGRIFVERWDYSGLSLIAGASNGFTSVGEAGISDDGRVVSFYGNLTEAGAAAINTAQASLGLNLNPVVPGPGIYASIRVVGGAGSSARYIQKIAGVSGNQILDPGEGFLDSNANGIFEPGLEELDYTTRNPVSGFDSSVRVAATRLGNTDEYQVAYIGEGELGVSSPRTLYTSYFRLPSSSTMFTVSAPTTIVKRGESIPGLGVVTDLNIHDPLNSRGEVAFWVSTNTGLQGVVKATQAQANIEILDLDAVSKSMVRLKYRIEGQNLDRPFAIDLIYSTTNDFNAPPAFQTYLTKRVLPQRKVLTLPLQDDLGIFTTTVGEHEVTFDLAAWSGSTPTELEPTKQLRYIYAIADPLNEIREVTTNLLKPVDDLAGLSQRNDNLERLGTIDAETLVAAMDRGRFRPHSTGAALDMTVEIAETMVGPLNDALSEFLIFTIPQQAAFLAQVNHESNFASDGLMARSRAGELWEEWYVLSPRPYQHKAINKPPFIATTKTAYFNYWYNGGPAAGNRPGTDDGSRYFGRGPIQLTGRANYIDAGVALNIDLLTNPELVSENMTVGLRAAAWFFAERSTSGSRTSLNTADEIDMHTTEPQLNSIVQRITRIVNGHLTHFDDRILRMRQTLLVLRHPNRDLHRRQGS